MSNSVEVNSGNSLLPTLLGVLFIGLKLTHHIAWSWWWVLSPFWIGLALAIAFTLLAVVFTALFGAIFRAHRIKKNREAQARLAERRRVAVEERRARIGRP